MFRSPKSSGARGGVGARSKWLLRAVAAIAAICLFVVFKSTRTLDNHVTTAHNPVKQARLPRRHQDPPPPLAQEIHAPPPPVLLDVGPRKFSSPCIISNWRPTSQSCANIPFSGRHVCSFFDIVLDPQLVTVSAGGEDPTSVRDRSEEAEFPVFRKGAWCVPRQFEIPSNLNKKDDLGLHFRHLYESIITGGGSPTQQCAASSAETTIRGVTTFVTRYNYANPWWTWNEIFMQWLSVRDSDNVVLMDGHARGALDDLWSDVFGARLMRISQFTQPTTFEAAVFVPTGGAPMNPDYTWKGSPKDPCAIGVFDEFVAHVRRTYQVDLEQTATPFRIVLIDRKPYASHPRVKKIGRQWSNMDEELRKMRAALPDEHFQSVQLEALTVKQQMLLMAETKLLIGVHGAGLANEFFLPDGAVAIELVAASRANRLTFQSAAKWRPNIKYMRVQTVSVGNDVYSSDLMAGIHDWIDQTAQGRQQGSAQHQLLDQPQQEEEHEEAAVKQQAIGGASRNDLSPPPQPWSFGAVSVSKSSGRRFLAGVVSLEEHFKSVSAESKRLRRFRSAWQTAWPGLSFLLELSTRNSEKLRGFGILSAQTLLLKKALVSGIDFDYLLVFEDDALPFKQVTWPDQDDNDLDKLCDMFEKKQGAGMLLGGHGFRLTRVSKKDLEAELPLGLAPVHFGHGAYAYMVPRSHVEHTYKFFANSLAQKTEKQDGAPDHAIWKAWKNHAHVTVPLLVDHAVGFSDTWHGDWKNRSWEGSREFWNHK